MAYKHDAEHDVAKIITILRGFVCQYGVFLQSKLYKTRLCVFLQQNYINRVYVCFYIEKYLKRVYVCFSVRN